MEPHLKSVVVRATYITSVITKGRHGPFPAFHHPTGAFNLDAQSLVWPSEASPTSKEGEIKRALTVIQTRVYLVLTMCQNATDEMKILECKYGMKQFEHESFQNILRN